MNPETNRLTDLELLVTHLQRELEQMHTVILSQQDDIDGLSKRVDNLKAEVDVNISQPEDRDPIEERPPHY